MNIILSFINSPPRGFPFKIGFKIEGWSEESRVGKIECLEPIYFGYDLFKQKLFGKYKGEVIAWHKPLQSKFGSKIICDDYSLLIKLPFNLKAIKIFLSKEKIYLN